MDALLFYAYGDWFILYYEDLASANKCLDLHVIPIYGYKLVGFHSSKLSEMCYKACQAGHSVVVAEQVGCK